MFLSLQLFWEEKKKLHSILVPSNLLIHFPQNTEVIWYTPGAESGTCFLLIFPLNCDSLSPHHKRHTWCGFFLAASSFERSSHYVALTVLKLFVDEAGLAASILLASASQLQGLKAYATMPSFVCVFLLLVRDVEKSLNLPCVPVKDDLCDY